MRLGDAGAFWNGLALLLGPAILGGLVILAGEVSTDQAQHQPRWQTAAGALALVCILALALKASDVRMFAAAGETGVWGFLRILAVWSPLAILLLLAHSGLTFPTRNRAVFGLTGGILTIVVALVLGTHSTSRAPISEFWHFLGTVIWPADLGLLLVTAALNQLSLGRHRTAAWSRLAAGPVIAGILAYSIPRSAGLAAAGAIGVALAAYAVWFTSNVAGEESAADIWWWLLIATSSGAYPILAAFLFLRRKPADEPLAAT